MQTSILERLPHQIDAVYKEMLARQPLRFLLADDPGAGKTIGDAERLADLCRRHHVAELCLFGSALGTDFGTSSGVDVLYVFQPGARVGWWEMYDLERELSELFGRSVDLVPKQWVNPTSESECSPRREPSMRHDSTSATW